MPETLGWGQLDSAKKARMAPTMAARASSVSSCSRPNPNITVSAVAMAAVMPPSAGVTSNADVLPGLPSGSVEHGPRAEPVLEALGLRSRRRPSSGGCRRR